MFARQFIRRFETTTIKLEQTIINGEHPVCKNCIYFGENYFKTPNLDTNDRCLKFGTKNLVTGKNNYVYAESNRKKGSICGISGLFFEKHPTFI